MALAKAPDPGAPNIEGSDRSEAIKGSLTEGNGWLRGFDGNDVIYGTDRDEILSQDSGEGKRHLCRGWW